MADSWDDAVANLDCQDKRDREAAETVRRMREDQLIRERIGTYYAERRETQWLMNARGSIR